MSDFEMFLLFQLALVVAPLVIFLIIRRAHHNERNEHPNPDNLPPDSRVSEDEPRIWGNDD